MPSTYTLNNGIELIGTGEQSGTWGDTTNLNLELLDTALDGQVTVTLSSTGSGGSPNTLPISDGSSSNGRNRLVVFNDGSDIGGTVYVQLTPNDAEKIIYVRNSLSGSRSILLFQGTYNASNDYEIPAGTTAIVFFNGGGTGAVAANVFNNAYFDGLRLGSVSVTAILDEDNMASNSATALSTQQSIKAYVDTQVGANNELSEVLANGNTTGGTDISVSTGDDITFADSSKAIFGAGSDLQIYHSGTNSFIDDAGTGNLQIRASSQIKLQKYTGENMFVGIADGAASMYYDNSQKIATTSTGVDVTGTVTADGLTVDANTAKFSAGTSGDMVLTIEADTDNNDEGDSPSILFSQDGGNTLGRVGLIGNADDVFTGSVANSLYMGNDENANLQLYTTLTERLRIGGNGDITFYETDGTTASFVYDANGPLVINSGSETAKDFQVKSSGGSHMLFVNAGDDVVNINSSSARFNTDTKLQVQGRVRVGTGIGAETSGMTTPTQPTMILTKESNTPSSGEDRIYALAAQNSGYAASGSTPPMSILLGGWQNGSSRSGGIEFDPSDQGLYVLAGGSQTGYASTNRIAKFTPSSIVFNEDSEDVDFRVESDGQTHMFFVDASTNRIGIGEPSPDEPLHLTTTDDADVVKIESTNVGSNHGPNIRLVRNSSSPADNDMIGRVNFNGMNSAAEELTYAQVLVQMKDVTDGTEDARLKLGGLQGGTFVNYFDAQPTETVINEDSVDRDFRVESDSDTYMFFVDAGNNRVSINSSGLGSGRLNVSGTTVLQHSGIVSSQSNTALTIRDADSTNMRANFIVEDNINSSRGGLMIQATESGVTNDRDIYLQPHGGRVGILTSSPASGFDCRTAAVFNEAGANNDFRVESDTLTHQLFVDASVPSTSVGLSSPSYMFEVYHPTSNTVARFQSGDADVWIALQASGNTPADHRIGYETSQDTVTIISGGVVQVRAYPDRVDFPHCANATAALPGLTISDSNTGIYDPGADLFGFSCGGQHVATFGETSGTSFFSMGAAVKSAVAGVGRKGWSVEEDTAGGDVRHSVQADNTIYKIYSTQSGTQCGGIVVGGNGTTTTFNTSSDYRLKENVASMTGSIDRLKQLNPVTYDWISSGQAAEGFLAHESQTVVPDSVTGTKDATEEIGTLTKGGVVRDDHCTEPASLEDDEVWTRTGTEPVYQQIDHSRLVPLLTSALQEAVAKIEALETRVAALENA